MHFRKGGYSRVSETLQSPVDPVERIRWLLARQPMYGFREQEKHRRQKNRRGRRAEIEHRTPVISGEQVRSKHPAESSSQWISDHHQRNTQAAPLLVRELGNHSVGARKHAADAQTCEYTPNRKLQRTRDGSRPQHTHSHDHKTPEQRRPAPDFVCYPAQEDRADGHSYQFHGEHCPKSCLSYAPFLAIPGEAKAIDSTS